MSATKHFWYMFHLFVMFAILLFVGLHFDFTQGDCEYKYSVDYDSSDNCVGEVSACNDDKYCGTPTSVLFGATGWGSECWCRESKQIHDSTISFLVFGCCYWCYVAFCWTFICCDEDGCPEHVITLSHVGVNFILMICILCAKPWGTSYGAFALTFWILQLPLFCATVYSDSFCPPDKPPRAETPPAREYVADLNDTYTNNQNQWQSNYAQQNDYQNTYNNPPASTELHTVDPYQQNSMAYQQPGFAENTGGYNPYQKPGPTVVEGWGVAQNTGGYNPYDPNAQTPPTYDNVVQPQPAAHQLTSSTIAPQTGPGNIADEIATLEQMRNNGILNDEEFEMAKSKIMNQ